MMSPAILLLLLATSNSFTEARLTFTGFGALRIGMSESIAANTFGAVLSNTSHEECKYYNIPGNSGISFIVENGQVVRVDLYDSPHRTLSGLAVGDSEEKARSVYSGRLEVTGHAYDENGHYLTIRSRDRRYAMVIETDGKSVTFLRSGLLPAAEYIEGCQ